MQRLKLILIWVFTMGAFYHLIAQGDPMLPWSNINPHPEFQLETVVKALLQKGDATKNSIRIEGWKEVENPDSIRRAMASHEIGEIINMRAKTINHSSFGGSPGLGVMIGNQLVDFIIHKTFEHSQTREKMTVLRAFQQTEDAEYRYLLWGHLTGENDFAYCLGTGRRFPFETSQTRKPGSPSLVYPGGHTSVITKVKFSRDGNSIFSGGDDYNIKQWDLQSRMEISNYDFHQEGIASIETSHDGTKVFSTDYQGTGLIWDIQSGRTMRQYRTWNWNRRNITIHPDWKFMVSIEKAASNVLEPSRRGIVINVTNFDTDQIYSVYHSPEESISHPSFIPGTNRLLFFQEKKAMVYDFDRRRVVYSFTLPFRVFKMAISPDGKKLAITDRNFNSPIEIWNINAGRRINSIVSGHKGNINNLHFTQDGKKLISSAQKLKVWDAFSFREIATYTPSQYGIFAMDSSPDGKLLAIGGGVPSYAMIKVLNLETGRILFDFSTQKEVSLSIDVAPDGRTFVSGGGTGYGGKGYHRVNLWDLNNIFLKEIFPVPHSRILTLDFSHDGNYLLTGQEYYYAYKLWDITNKKESKTIKNEFPVHHSRFLRDGKRLLNSDENGFIKLRDLQTGDILLRLNQSNFGNGWLSIESLDLSDDEKLVLASSGGKTTLWDLETEEKKLTLRGDYGSFLPGLEKFISSIGNSVFVHDLNGELISQFWDASCKDDRSWEFVSIPNTSEIIMYCGENLKKWDFERKIELIKFETASKQILTATYSPQNNLLLTAAGEGFIEVWNNLDGKKVATLFTVGERGWLVSTPELYYRATRGALDGIGFKKDELIFPFEQFDLRLNRPDKVLESFLPFGADSSLIHLYREAYYKRLEKYGFTEDKLSNDYRIPECYILNKNDLPVSTSASSINLNLLAVDSLHSLDRLNVFINDVPIFGIQGINLRPLNTQEYHVNLEIPLSRGENKIQVSTLNQGGGESLKATSYVTYNAPERKTDLYLITIGVSKYRNKDKTLLYAAKDAYDISRFYEQANSFQNIHHKTLLNKKVTKENILALRTWLEQSQVDDQVLLYVSGHGLIDNNYDFYYATHDIDFANPAEKGILYDEIESLLDGIPARKKLLLMDACHSGEFDEDAPALTAGQQKSLAQKGVSFKGFVKGDGKRGPTLGLQNSFELMQQLFADLRRGSGATVISSSAGVQVSYEDEQWQNGAFTYAFLYGLKSMKADANGDGQVTASEIQAFVAEYVPRLTEGLQVPTFRRENLEYDFRVW